ncbi:hypothetical protein KCU92_g265, partial [Aureobasidium melanogenum]
MLSACRSLQSSSYQNAQLISDQDDIQWELCFFTGPPLVTARRRCERLSKRKDIPKTITIVVGKRAKLGENGNGSHDAPSQNFPKQFLTFTTPMPDLLKVARTAKEMIPPGFEPGTACVLDRSDNQLHHRTMCLMRVQCARLIWHQLAFVQSPILPELHSQVLV